MLYFVESVVESLFDGGHAHIFCTIRHFPNWCSVLSQILMYVPEPSDRLGKMIIEESGLTVEKNRLFTLGVEEATFQINLEDVCII